ncbi:MAG TPA: hypothetical protein VF989_01760 [Polyangiaceae bacterium]
MLLLPPVVVDISADHATPALIETLLAACTEAVAEAECRLDDGGTSGPLSAVAIVSFGESGVRIDVGVRLEGGEQWRARELRFEAGDVPPERWRATGFTIGTLTGELRGFEAASQREPDAPSGKDGAAEGVVAPPSVVLPAASEPGPEDQTSVAPPPWRYWSAFGLLVGPGFRDGPWRVGGSARVGLIPPDSVVRANAGFSYAARTPGEDSVRAEWLTLSAGLGLPVITAPRFVAIVELDASIQRIAVTAERGGERGGASRWVGAGGGGVALEVPLVEQAALFARLHLDVLGGTTDILLGDQRVAGSAVLSPSGSVGLQIGP